MHNQTDECGLTCGFGSVVQADAKALLDPGRHAFRFGLRSHVQGVDAKEFYLFRGLEFIHESLEAIARVVDRIIIGEDIFRRFDYTVAGVERKMLVEYLRIILTFMTEPMLYLLYQRIGMLVEIAGIDTSSKGERRVLYPHKPDQ